MVAQEVIAEVYLEVGPEASYGLNPLMSFGVSLIAISILLRVVMLMRYDRISKKGDPIPRPEGFDPEQETLREFYIRTRFGLFLGIMICGCVALLGGVALWYLQF